jgi:hypothetical protein
MLQAQQVHILLYGCRQSSHCNISPRVAPYAKNVPLTGIAAVGQTLTWIMIFDANGTQKEHNI